MRVIRHADCPPAPWKNGAGSTRELWCRADAEGVLARISLAEITGDQPFSAFPGMDRVILQLDGPPMRLTVEGQDHPIATPFAFPGEARVTCHLSAPGRAHDLNLMTRRGTCAGRMTLLSLAPDASLTPDPGASLTALLALTPCTLDASAPVTLAPLDLLLIPQPLTLRARTAAQCVCLTVSAPAPSP
ncbi:MAG: HutD family protein [Gemmobacter sp.]|uniref:HutD/Ves family protein n=1 Tax=Gemmobacter sp. TaxID=1898957 RepID=UPI001A542CC8|nr:HutD family protein [Gemmobacter sp.]MBL8562028.1 HutD family protein [Gemmobacter sp.]